MAMYATLVKYFFRHVFSVQFPITGHEIQHLMSSYPKLQSYKQMRKYHSPYVVTLVPDEKQRNEKPNRGATADIKVSIGG